MYKMTFQISSSERKFSQIGMAEFHGCDSGGRPGPPLAMRQKTYDSCNWAMVPTSTKFAGEGMNPWAKCPVPSRLSPWQGQF